MIGGQKKRPELSPGPESGEECANAKARQGVKRTGPDCNPIAESVYAVRRHLQSIATAEPYATDLLIKADASRPIRG
jgi:hypothetical protein